MTPFELRTTVYTPPESQPLTRYVVLLETNQIGFLPPVQWSVQARPKERKVILSPANGSIQINFCLWPEYAGKTNLITKAESIAIMAKSFPGATIKEEYPFQCGSGAGIGYELNNSTAPGIAKLTIKIAFVQLPVGLIEFQLLCPADQMETTRIPFSRFLSSFTLEPKAPMFSKADAK